MSRRATIVLLVLVIITVRQLGEASETQESISTNSTAMQHMMDDWNKEGPSVQHSQLDENLITNETDIKKRVGYVNPDADDSNSAFKIPPRPASRKKKRSNKNRNNESRGSNKNVRSRRSDRSGSKNAKRSSDNGSNGNNAKRIDTVRAKRNIENNVQFAGKIEIRSSDNEGYSDEIQVSGKYSERNNSNANAKSSGSSVDAKSSGTGSLVKFKSNDVSIISSNYSNNDNSNSGSVNNKSSTGSNTEISKISNINVRSSDSSINVSSSNNRSSMIGESSDIRERHSSEDIESINSGAGNVHMRHSIGGMLVSSISQMCRNFLNIILGKPKGDSRIHTNNEISENLMHSSNMLNLKSNETSMYHAKIIMNSDEISMNNNEILMNNDEIRMNSSEIQMNSKEVLTNSNEIQINNNEIYKNSDEILLNCDEISMNDYEFPINDNKIPMNSDEISMNSDAFAINIDKINIDKNLFNNEELAVNHDIISLLHDKFSMNNHANPRKDDEISINNDKVGTNSHEISMNSDEIQKERDEIIKHNDEIQTNSSNEEILLSKLSDSNINESPNLELKERPRNRTEFTVPVRRKLEKYKNKSSTLALSSTNDARDDVGRQLGIDITDTQQMTNNMKHGELTNKSYEQVLMKKRDDFIFDRDKKTEINFRDKQIKITGTNHTMRKKRNASPETGASCVRKDILSMSYFEREYYQATFKKWRTTRVNASDPNSMTHHQVFASYHTSEASPGAHFGACFIPFHRVYLAKMEENWKKLGCDTCSPFINWVGINRLNTPCDSCLFTEKYLGNSNGPIISGPAAYGTTEPVASCSTMEYGWKLYRDCMYSPDAHIYLYNQNVIDYLINTGTTYGRLCWPDYPAMENHHSFVHALIGGSVNSLSCAAFDPLFYCHHTYVDYLFSKIRAIQKAKGIPYWAEYPDPTEYPKGYWDPMYPFHNPPDDEWYCSSGLVDEFDVKYIYVDPPDKCQKDEDCVDPDDTYDAKMAAYWCNDTDQYSTDPRCTSKIKLGGNCTGYPDRSCYSGENKCENFAICSNEICTC